MRGASLILLSCLSSFALVNSLLRVYWNVPSSTCKQFGIHFNLTKYGIIQNKNDEFFGEKIGILYEPGLFPALISNARSTTRESSSVFWRNGGIPQLGNMSIHLKALVNVVNDKFPDPHYSGVAVMDMEWWRPLWQQLYVSSPSFNMYRNESINLEKKRYPCWNKQQQEKEAEIRFEDFARFFMERTLIFVKHLRPQALWGYYAYPFCFNYTPENNFDCPPTAKEDNDELSWLFNASGAVFPSAYISTMDPAEHRETIIRARIAEGKRVAGSNDVLSYMRFRYVDQEIFLSKSDLKATLRAPISMNLSGLIIWGSSSDVNTLERCQNLNGYIEKTLGPTVRRAVLFNTVD